MKEPLYRAIWCTALGIWVLIVIPPLSAVFYMVGIAVGSISLSIGIALFVREMASDRK